MDVLKWVEVIAGAAGAFALFWSGFRGNLSKDTIRLMKENKEAADEAIKRLEDDAHSKTTQIANLTGQIQMLKDVPLAQIAKSLEIVMKSHQAIEQLVTTRSAVAEQIANATADKVVKLLKDNKDGNTN